MDETLGSGVVSEKVGEILFDEGQVPVLVSPPFGVFQATDLTMKEKPGFTNYLPRGLAQKLNLFLIKRLENFHTNPSKIFKKVQNI